MVKKKSPAGCKTMERKKPFQVAVIGGSNPEPDLVILAIEVGRVIARLGGIVICGGLGGVMEAVARGAKLEKGLTIGILPGYDAKAGNPFIDIAIPTGMGHARNVLVASAGDAIVALPGSHGTRSEISLALALEKPVFGMQAWAEIPGVRSVANLAELKRILLPFV